LRRAESKLHSLVKSRTVNKTLDFIEPDFEFDFCPSNNKVKPDEYTYAVSKHEISLAIVEWKVNLWCEGLTDNYFSTSLDKEECKVLRDYLRLVMGKLDKDSIEIQEYVKAGFIDGLF
jgi:hypothetical protein